MTYAILNLGLTRGRELAAQHTSQTQQAGAKQCQCAGLRNGRRIVVGVIVNNRDSSTRTRSLISGEISATETLGRRRIASQIKGYIAQPLKGGQIGVSV